MGGIVGSGKDNDGNPFHSNSFPFVARRPFCSSTIQSPPCCSCTSLDALCARCAVRVSYLFRRSAAEHSSTVFMDTGERSPVSWVDTESLCICYCQTGDTGADVGWNPAATGLTFVVVAGPRILPKMSILHPHIMQCTLHTGEHLCTLSQI